MNLIEKLNDVSNSTKELSFFLNENINTVYDFFINQNYSELLKYKDELGNYIHKHLKLFKKLDFLENENKTFILLLLNASERFDFRTYFQRIYRLLEKKSITVGKRHEATAMYFIGIREFSDYEKILQSFLEKLQDAYETEEDNENKVITVFINFYAKIVYDFGEFNPEGVISINKQIRNIKEKYPFLKNEIINNILAINISDFESAYNEILFTLDNHLNRRNIQINFVDDKNLIESNTEYCTLFQHTYPTFNTIHKINQNRYKEIKSDKIFISLGRGVKILEKEEQLYAYIYSFGNMHNQKLISAFEFLPEEFFSKTINIVDWGCGQAIGSVSYIDYLNKNNFDQNIKLITLNEPSEIALKRGSLHIKKMIENVGVLTVNKDLNSLESYQFKTNKNATLHIFSNILDIDDYSVDKLSRLIKSTFKGTNFFIIASPYMTEIKRYKIDSFVESFENIKNFDLIASINNKKGEWKNNWSRVIRVFKVDL